MLSARSLRSFILAGALLPALLALLAPAVGAEQATDLVVNGGFEADADGDGWPDGWPKGNGVSVAREGGNAWLRLDGPSGVTQTIRIQPDWWKLKLTCRMRATDVTMGKEGWQDARLAMNFVDEKGMHLDPWPNVFHAQGTTGWIDCEREYKIPAGAASLHLQPGMMGASGRVEFDDIHLVVTRLRSKGKEDLPPPDGARNLWSMGTAWRRKSATRESICLNDLWRFLPLAQPAGESVPGANEGWGWFKVPGIWPRTASDEAQEVLLSDFVEEQVDLGRCDQAWYKREVTVPAEWQGRRIQLDFGMVQTHARVFLDGRPAGEVWFPGGLLDITKGARPGAKQELAVLVTARPTESESQVFMAPDRIVKSQARIDLRGLTGDVFLVSEPAGEALGDVRVVTSVREKRIALDTAVQVAGSGAYRLQATVTEGGKPVKRFESAPFRGADVKEGRFSFAAAWADAKLWDLDTPGDLYDVVVALRDAAGKVVDETLPVRFGFREFRIQGRDFLLNEKPVHLRALFLRNMAQGADKASLQGSRRALERMREYGFNFFITSNYHFKPGAVGYMEGLLDAADQSGLLCSFSLPHVRDFRIDADKPESAAAYRRLTEWLIRRVQNHPSIVLYAMNHNATGYYGDQNPLKIDGVYSPDDPVNKGDYRGRIRREAMVADGIAKSLDPSRPVYHHQSGNLGDMHTVNIYLNWAPLQERSDWLEHWGTKGVKPLFFVEWGLPHVSSWSSYRGPAFIWRTEAYQSVWDSEYAAAYLGQRAYRMSPTKVRSMAHEEDLWSRGKPFAWGHLIQHLRTQEENYMEVQALFASDNWRAHRTWGLSAGLPWDQGGLWRKAPGPSDELVIASAPYEGLQKPGIVPDRLLPSDQYLDANDASTQEPTVLGRAFLRWNRPLCAYIGGGPRRFTEKGHSFSPGGKAAKQLVVLNDTRRDAACAWSWTLSPGGAKGSGRVVVTPGGKALVPISVPLTGPGKYLLRAKFDFGAGGVQEDTLDLHVLPALPSPPVRSRVTLYDPKGMTARVLDNLGIRYARLQAGAPLPTEGILVIGREALAVDGPALDLSRVRDGLKVLVFEQSYDVLVQRFGFRANIHGARNAFIRAAGHPALEGLADDHLRDWRGAATLVPPDLGIEGPESTDPKWSWLGFTNTRAWRCGNHGSVATVLIEKPSRGTWLPLVDCAFDLQYSPLLEHTEGKGRVLFCQLDVTGRTEEDPAARRLCANLVRYLDAAPAPEYRPVLYAGDDCGAGLLRDLGVPFERHPGGGPAAASLLVLGPGAPAVTGLDAALAGGLKVLALGLSAVDMDRALPGLAKVKERPVVPSLVESFARPELTGISNAELHWRTLLTVAALEGPGEGNEALRVIERGPGRVVLCQAAPWAFDTARKPYLRTTYRRSVFLVSRLLANLGAPAEAPLLKRMGAPAEVCDWTLPKAWKGRADKEQVGEAQGWSRPDFDDAAWKPIGVPGTFESQVPELTEYDGDFWYRIRFAVPKGLSPEGLRLEIGPVDDESWTWLNGRFLGEVTAKTQPEGYWSFPRVYDMEPGMLREGEANVLVVRVRDLRQSGGILGTPRLTAKGPWLRSYYLQEPEAVDDPYRYYRW